MKNISERICKWWKKAATWLDSKRHLSIFIVVTFTIYIFYIPIKKLLLTKFIAPIFDDLPNNDTLRSFIVLFLLLFSICYCINHLCHKRRPSIDSTFTILLISIIYFFLFRPDKDFYYFRFLSFDIYLSDLIWLSSLLIILDYQLITLPLKQDNSYLLEDDTSQDEIDKDLLYRNNFSKTIANVINNTAPKKAIAIAVLAKWGFGKTVFLRQLEKELENDNSTNIVLQFNPWKVDGNVNIIQVFFEELSEKLAKYDHSAIKNFKNYAQKLSYNTDNDLAIIKLAKSLFGSFFFNQLSITKQHDEIDRNIKRIGKRVIVLIDDLDRLSGDELAPIMRLIRNVADFQNVIFVAAFDRSYVTSALSKTEKLTNEEKYLEKIFQIEIPLPPIKVDIISQELERLISPLLLPNHLLEFRGWVNPIFGNGTNAERIIHNTINDVLLNIRDIRRFINSFKITYELTKEELLFEDIFVLELIKFTSVYVYDLLAHMELIEDTDPNYFKFSEKKFNSIFDNHENKRVVLTNNKDIIKGSISFLYSQETLNGRIRKETTTHLSRPLVIKQNHYFYFNYQLFGEISMKEFREASEKNFDSLATLIDKYQKSIDDYISIVQKSISNNFDEKFKIFLQSLVYCNKYDENKKIILGQIVYNIISKYYINIENNEEELKKLNIFLEEFLNGRSQDMLTWKDAHVTLSYTTLHIFNLHISYIGTSSKIKILSREKLIEINQYLFRAYIGTSNASEDHVYELFLNTRSILNGQFNDTLLNEDICKEYFKYLKENNKYYISILIRPYPTKQNLYVFDPYILQIFGSYDKFKNFLSQLKDTDYSKYYLEKFNEYEKNNYNPIEILDFENFKLSYHTV